MTRIAPVLIATLLALTGCSKADLLNLIIPDTGYSVRKDIAYGSEPEQKLDIYLPDQPDAARHVIVFFYGGSWQSGEKELYKFAGQAFASRGYIVLIPDYRKYPQVYFPAFVEDAAAAVVWTHAHIGEFGGDSAKLTLVGHSAGAHISMMLTLNEHFLKAAGGSARWIASTVGMAGPYDFLPFTDPKVKALFSTAPDQDTQPIHFVRPHTPPILLLTAENDKEVGAENTRNLYSELRKNGDRVEQRTYPGIGHIKLVLSLAYGFRSQATTLDDIDRFIRNHSN